MPPTFKKIPTGSVQMATPNFKFDKKIYNKNFINCQGRSVPCLDFWTFFETFREHFFWGGGGNLKSISWVHFWEGFIKQPLILSILCMKSSKIFFIKNAPRKYPKMLLTTSRGRSGFVDKTAEEGICWCSLFQLQGDLQ